MKNKSTRHKELNTFKFQPFSERISQIDIDIFHKVRHEYESQTEEGQCYFYEAVEKWNVLNLTEGYNRFKREVKAQEYITLPQLLLAKDHVVSVLLEHLKLKDTLYLQPLLEIVVAIAKDLQKEFYPFYPKFLEVIIDLLNTKDTEQLEWTFTCLAYLFKFLWRSFVKDINNVLHTLLPLLSDSRPEYINNFAAESFAFVARKVKDREAFLGLLLKVVKNRKDGINGCGRLLFEVLNGVDGQFHSCAETFFPFLLESLFSTNFPQTVLFEILEQIVANIVQNIHYQKSDLLWKTFLSTIEILCTTYSNTKDEKTVKNIYLILSLLGQSIEHKSGKLLSNPWPVIQQLIKILNLDFPEDVIMTVVKISISLLLARNIKMPQEQASSLIRKILSVNNKNVLLFFVENMRESSSFKTLVLPSFLRICNENDLDDECFTVLTKILLQEAPVCFSGITLENWHKYNLDFKENNNKILEKLGKYINKDNKSSMLENTDKYICSLIILPHLNISNKDNILVILEKDLKFIIDELNNAESTHIKKLLFLLNITIECLVHLNAEDILICHFATLQKNIESIWSNDNPVFQLFCLKILSLLVSFLRNKNEIISGSTFEDLRYIFQCFSSPYHEIRLLSTHIFTFFEKLPMFEVKHSDDPEAQREDFKFFTICYTVESIEPHVHTYRDQLHNVDKLTWDKPQAKMCYILGLTPVALRYLCGVLYMNFQLLWEPVIKIIESCAHGILVLKNSDLKGETELDVNFWSVYGQQLEMVTNKIQNLEETETGVIETNYEFVKNLFQSYEEFSVKPDFVNYRILLWKGLALFPDYAEKYTKVVVKLFLDFVRAEYFKSHKDFSISCDIKKHDESFEQPEDPENIEENTKTNDGKQNVKLLLQELSVFSKVKSPMSMYKETELSQLYMRFLQHKNASIQKAALDCILTYKYKFLTPYKEHLYNLIDDKMFKHEVTSFRIDVDSDMVRQEHRKDLVPFIMQIVFSKMMVKTGLRTGGKSSGQTRRNLVFRFLAGCQEDEMITFVRKAFDFDDQLLEKDIADYVQEFCELISLENFLTPRRIQSRLNMLNVVIDQFGGLMGNDLLTRLVNILTIAGVYVKRAFDKISDVYTGYIPMLRNIRSLCIKTLERIFEQFHKYPWTSSQINAIFYTFIWPYLDKLNTENIHSPTSLLKLFKCWGSNPRYFSLFVKCDESNINKHILPKIINLLSNEKCNYIVINYVQEIIENLLKLVPDEDDLKIVIPVDNLKPVEKYILERVAVQESLNYGSCILLPYVPIVLQKLKRRLESKNKHLTNRELFILSRISELVWEAEISDAILQLLLPVVLKKCSSSEEIVLQFFNTILNLLKNVKEPHKHIRQISPLFGTTTYTSCRKVLTQVLAIVADKDSANLVSELNAWDIKWLDQPDFEKRHRAFKTIEELVSTESIDTNLGILIIYNCYFSVSSQKDLSLREIATHTLRILCPYLIRNAQKDLNFILNDTIFPLIRNGMKSKNDDLRNECISLLGHLARECPDSHFILRDLSIYSNKQDLEVDFFENLTHLQLHRHVRALQKFSQITRDQLSAPNARTLTQFILPLTSFYLCSEKYASKNSMVDSAIEAIGVISKILPWHQYEGLLKYYLSRLRYKVEFQKQLVRLTVAILDGFHFDLSKGNVAVVKNEAEKVVDSTNGQSKAKADVEEEIKDKSLEAVDEEEAKKEESAEDIDEQTESKEEKEVDVALDEIEEAELEEEKEPEAVELKVCERITVLCKSTATRVIRSIQLVLLPQLQKSLAHLTQYDSSHKINRKKTGFEREEEDLLRVPISLAVVKLLQRLPKQILDAHLSGVLVKLCTFLKSQLESVRRVARETLQKIMLTLGPKYLKLLLEEMSALLRRGFQVHVLVYTTHGVLNCLKDLYEPLDIDNVLLTVLDLCKTDLFGVLSEEKEVAKIGVKTSEAKSTKSFDTLQILAKYITEKCMLDLIMPIKDILENTHSFKAVHKAQEALRYIALGLVDNEFISLESLLKFAYGTASESIPQLLPKKKSKLSDKQQEKLQREKEDCFIIPKIPGNRTAYRQANVKTSLQTNAHLLVEFGLRLCFSMLKREKLKDEEFVPFIDPFVPVFKNCLKSKVVKLCTLTLQCLTWIMKYELPSIKVHIKSITKEMFTILYKYASSGLSKGDNFDLVHATFKAAAVLVRDIKYYSITTDQLKILLFYTEQDMHDHDRQATAFNLLKAIIARKLVVSEMHDIMEKVAELSITSELNYVRSQARGVFYQFIMEYPLGNTLEKHLSFYIGQLSYDLQYGRESAIEMIQTLINSFPHGILKAQSGTLFITLGARLVNDEAPECRKMVAECISSMLKKLTKTDRIPLFDMVVLWLKEKNISHRRLAAQLCGIFVSVEKSDFESRLKVVTPLILKQFGLSKSPGKFVKVQKEPENKDDEEHQRVKDHHHFQVLQLILKICQYCPSFLKQKDTIQNLAFHAQALLSYPHDWVRLAAAQFLGFVLSSMDIEQLGTLLAENKILEDGYLCTDPVNSIKSLTLDLCDQLQPTGVKSDLAEQVIKNLVFIARVLQKVGDDSDCKVNLLWLAKRMRKIVNQEVIENSSSTILRKEVFKWIGGVATALDLGRVKAVHHHLLAPLVREMITTDEKNAPLRQIAKEVANILKNKVGMEQYMKTLSKLQQTLSVRRAERKRSRTQIAVTDPELFAKKKIKRQEKKKVAKKRKIADIKRKKTFKKRKVVDLEDNSDVL